MHAATPWCGCAPQQRGKKEPRSNIWQCHLRRPNQRSYSDLNPPPPHSRTVMRRTIWQGIYSSPSCTYLDLRSQISNIHSATTPTRLCTSNHISRWHTGTLAASFRFLPSTGYRPAQGRFKFTRTAYAWKMASDKPNGCGSSTSFEIPNLPHSISYSAL